MQNIQAHMQACGYCQCVDVTFTRVGVLVLLLCIFSSEHECALYYNIIVFVCLSVTKY